MVKYLAPLAALLASTAHAADDQKMKGIGLPVIFISFFLVAGLLSRNQLLAAISNKDPESVWVFRASLLCAFLSIFFYLSPAWNYGIVSTVLAFGIAVATNSGLVKTAGKYIAMTLFVWFLILIGIPQLLTNGIITTVSQTSCQGFYGDFSPEMCKDGWLTFLMILSTVQISVTFLSMLSVMASALGGGSSAAAADSRSGKNGEYQERFVEGSANN